MRNATNIISTAVAREEIGHGRCYVVHRRFCTVLPSLLHYVCLELTRGLSQAMGRLTPEDVSFELQRLAPAFADCRVNSTAWFLVQGKDDLLSG